MFKNIASAIGSGLSFIPILFRDLAGLAAVGSIAYGSWMLHPAAGFIVGGSLVLAGVILSVNKAG